MENIKLTAKQQQQWEDTMSYLMWKAPGFRRVMFRMLNAQRNRNSPSDYVAKFTNAPDVWIAATDGYNMLINPVTFFDPQVTLGNRAFVEGHEIFHEIYGDVETTRRLLERGWVPVPGKGQKRPFVMPLWQKAMDARINLLLIDSKIGEPLRMFNGKPCGWYDDKVKPEDGVFDIYKRYYDEQQSQGGGQQGQQGQQNQSGQPQKGQGQSQQERNPGGFDQVLEPGAGHEGDPREHKRDETGWKVAIRQAQHLEEQNRGIGKMPGSLSRMFKEILQPQVPWQEHIRVEIMRNTGDGHYDWTLPDPWLGMTPNGKRYFSPRPTGKGAGVIVCWGDTSGSRGDIEIASSIGECGGIFEDVNPERLIVIWDDARIHHVDEITDMADLKHIQARGVGGGGGTSYQPVLQWIEKNLDEPPDLFIGFTDGEVSHPKRPPYPVIWASTTDKPYPWGKVVRITPPPLR